MDTMVRERCSYSTTRMEKKKTDKGFYISGFASSSTTDRDSDAIDPKLFDLETYKKNPQLWVNHSLWNDGKGNGISVGVVEDVIAVKVAFKEGDTHAKLLDLVTDEVVRDDVSIDEFLFKNGEAGLWVVCKIEEADVIALVETKRLNAFSWSGTSQRKRNGAIKSIDLWEISLVNVPANQKAVFRIGKSFRITDDSNTMVVIDLDAVASLLDYSSIEKKFAGLTAEEIKQLATQTSSVDNKGAVENITETKGGESDMSPEDKKSIEDMVGGLSKTVTDAMAGVTAKVDTIAQRMDALEIKGDDKEEKAPKKKPTPEEIAMMEEKEKADKEKKDEKKSADGDDISATLKSLTDTVKGFVATTEKSLEGITNRIEKMEKKPADSKAASDDEEDNDVEAATKAEAKSLAAVREKLNAMPAEQRAALEKRGLANAMIPDFVGSGNRQ